MNSYSQAGQDRFVNAVLDKDDGTFLDIGACHPTELSNTFALEAQRGWRGLLVDNDPGAVKLLREQRESPAIFADSTKVGWAEAFKQYKFGPVIDYLSLDVDAATLNTLKGLPLADVRFRVITIEHDAYRFGDAPRVAMREILKANGYQLVAANVSASTGEEFEDWWTAPDLEHPARTIPFISVGKRWPELFA